MHWTLVTALKTVPAESIVVSSDDADALAYARNLDVSVIQRPAELARDNTPIGPVVRHALNETGSQAAIVLQVTSPFRRSHHIADAIRQFSRDGRPLASVVRAEHPIEWHCEWPADSEELKFVHQTSGSLRRQECKPWYRLNGAIFLASAQTWSDQDALMGVHGLRPFLMDPASSLDIDSEWDLAFGEFLVATGRAQVGQ